MESLTESGVLWSLLLDLESQPLQWYLKKMTEGPAGAELCYWHGSEEIPAVSVQPSLCVTALPHSCPSSLGPTT